MSFSEVVFIYSDVISFCKRFLWVTCLPPTSLHYCTGPKWHGHCYNGIDDETADVVDGVMATSPLTRRLIVNRAMLNDAEEAWIHVCIAPDEDAKSFGAFDGFPSALGVLTWENSDEAENAWPSGCRNG